MKLRTRTNQPVEGDEIENLNVSGELKAFENIVDAQGNKRFVEGVITPNETTGFTFSYARWSLSGTHIMIVLAGVIASGTTKGSATLANFQVPSWVYDKIVPCGNTEKQVIVKYADLWKDATIPLDKKMYCGIQKQGGANNLQIATWDSETFSDDTYFRIAFDLLIDNE